MNTNKADNHINFVKETVGDEHKSVMAAFKKELMGNLCRKYGKKTSVLLLVLLNPRISSKSLQSSLIEMMDHKAT